MRIGIDLGGTTVSIGLVNDRNEIVEKVEGMSRCSEGVEAVIDRIAGMTELLLQKAGNPAVSCMGLGCPGVLNREEGIVVYSNNIKWRQVPVCRELENRLHIPVYVENDANCAAVGEYLAGAGKGSSHMIMITFGTGIGGGIILNGKLFLGKHGNANIVGHICMEKDGKKCTCSRRGCWENYASTKALISMARQEGMFTGLPEQKIKGQRFFEALRQNDETAVRVFDRYMDYAAEGIADLINILDPERIVIGGGISAQGEILLAPIREKVKQKIFFSGVETADIVCSALANDAAIIGAANLPEIR